MIKERWPPGTCLDVIRVSFPGSTTAAFWCSIAVAKKEDLEIIATWIQRGYCSGLGVEVIGAPSLSVGFSVLQEVKANR